MTQHSPAIDKGVHTVTLPIADYERMMRGLARYEFVRRLSVTEFKEMLFDRHIADGIPFDELVDIEMACAARKTAMRRCEEIQQGRYETWNI